MLFVQEEILFVQNLLVQIRMLFVLEWMSDFAKTSLYFPFCSQKATYLTLSNP